MNYLSDKISVLISNKFTYFISTTRISEYSGFQCRKLNSKNRKSDNTFDPQSFTKSDIHYHALSYEYKSCFLQKVLLCINLGLPPLPPLLYCSKTLCLYAGGVE